MRGGLRIGRIHGIDLVVDWSWSLVFLLMTWNLTVLFHQWHPTWTFGGRISLAIAATLLFFGSLIAHELAHSLVAQSYGMKVREIRIFLFGGVANLDREPPTAAAELWMAIVGPLTSLALGVLFIGLAGTALPRVDALSPWETLAGLGPLATLFFWLGPVNVAVGLFNMFPAFPLDGGRVFRAALWWVTGNLQKATAVAANLGRATGWVFIVAGVAMVFGARLPGIGGSAGNGIWLAFIGWFLKESARDSAGAQMVYDALQDLRVHDLMRRTGPVVPSNVDVRGLAEGWFLHSGERAFPVVEGERIVGIVSIGDLEKVERAAWAVTPITDIMTPHSALAVVGPDLDAGAALRLLLERSVHQLPVVAKGEGDVLVGMLFGSDIMRWVELRARAPHRPMRPQLST